MKKTGIKMERIMGEIKTLNKDIEKIHKFQIIIIVAKMQRLSYFLNSSSSTLYDFIFRHNLLRLIFNRRAASCLLPWARARA